MSTSAADSAARTQSVRARLCRLVCFGAAGARLGGRTCPSLREEPWESFYNLRTAVHGRVPIKAVLAKANELASALLAEMRKEGKYTPLPVLIKDWLLRWQRDYGVCFRLPTLRFKGAWTTLSARCAAMWRSVYMVRAFAQECFGHDLPLYGLDQTPLYMNEAGSRQLKTLAIRGSPVVALRENCAATRARLSVLTCVCSDREVALQPGGLPVEAPFRGRSARTIKGIEVPPRVDMSIAWQVKGSNRSRGHG